MNNFDDVNVIALANAENDLLQAGLSYESFADLLADDEDDADDEIATKCRETSQRTLAQINRELAEIALADAALAMCDGKTVDNKRLAERSEGCSNNPAGCQSENFFEEGKTSGITSAARSHLNVLQAVDAIVQFGHFEVDGLVTLPQHQLP
ncbi:MAG: hypothetical protein JNL18_18055 [Planctomycetaceae bacterium]|nr:hypothetical protein [Planctomycetaceae bacterium]